MGSRLSSVDEMRLTHAIEKAATLASVSDADRSGILSEQLIKADVDPKFAKVASAAFNKRLTVLTLEKTADEHKADPFPLADAAVVCEMMGGDADGGVFRKSASYDPSTGAFEISFEAYSAPVMRKAASMPRHVNMEERLDYRQLQEKVGILMDKNAAAYQELGHKMATLDSMLNKQAAELSSALCGEGGEFLLGQLVGIHGQQLAAELGARCVSGMEKEAGSRASNMDTYRMAGEFMDKCAMYSEYEEFMRDYESGLCTLSKAAAELGGVCARAEMLGMTKQAVDPITITAVGQGLTGAIGGIKNEVIGAANAKLNNAYNLYGTSMGVAKNLGELYEATRKVDADASKLIDADFILNDRKHDRMLAWTDMAADPAFSMYPSEQLFVAANRLMDTDSELEKPYRREMLRAQLGQVLAQNGRQSSADIAATAATLKAFNNAKKDALEASAERKALATSVHGPAKANLTPTLAGVKITPFDEKLGDGVLNTVNNSIKAHADIIQKRLESEARKRENAVRRALQISDRDEARRYNEKREAQRKAEQIAARDEARSYNENREAQREQRRSAEEAAKRTADEVKTLGDVNYAAREYKTEMSRLARTGRQIHTGELEQAALQGQAELIRLIDYKLNDVKIAFNNHRNDFENWLSTPDGAYVAEEIKAISDHNALGALAVPTITIKGNAKKGIPDDVRSFSTVLATVSDLKRQKGKQFNSVGEIDLAAERAKSLGGFNPYSPRGISGGGRKGNRP